MNTPDTQLFQQLLEEAQPASIPGVPEFFPPDAPFDKTQRDFLNGLFAGAYTLARSARSAELAQTPLSIFFASQTGTAEALAKKLRKFAAGKGFKASVAELDSLNPAELAELGHVIIVAATSGEGEPPDNALGFYTAIMAEDAAPLPSSLNYSVCGLGDTSYAYFNKISKELDARLELLGASRAAPLVTCDVDYEEEFDGFRDAVFESSAFVEAAGASSAAEFEIEEAVAQFDKNRPFLATLINSECLSGRDSAKRINHIEISLSGGGEDLRFEVGDALGLVPLNDMAEVDAVLALTGFTGREPVLLRQSAGSLRQTLFRCLDLVTVTEKTAELWEVAYDAELQLIDVLAKRSPDSKSLTPQDLVDGLRSLQPRLYSISSSPNKHPGEVHLTVGEVHYEINNCARSGVASNYLGSRLPVGGAVGVYVQKANHFALPQDDNAPLIMIGPGTGVAPFRAFLEEREVRAAPGKNWLFFGDQHEASDFLYREQMQEWSKSGLLNNQSLAWSRDSAEKVYVQHLIVKEGAEFYRWLQEGAAIYICGDAAKMAPDVEAAILSVMEEHGEMSDVEARLALEDMRRAGRYCRDVY